MLFSSAGKNRVHNNIMLPVKQNVHLTQCLPSSSWPNLWCEPGIYGANRFQGRQGTFGSVADSHPICTNQSWRPSRWTGLRKRAGLHHTVLCTGLAIHLSPTQGQRNKCELSMVLKNASSVLRTSHPVHTENMFF